MKCVIVDDEPLAREGLEILVGKTGQLKLLGSFNSADAASKFLEDNPVDLVFLDIQMPGTTGLQFAKTIPSDSLVIFTTAYSEYAIDSYEVDALDYLVKPVILGRFQKAVDKAASYLKLLKQEATKTNIEQTSDDYFFIKADRKVFKAFFNDILFVEGLKDYVVLHTSQQRIITAMNIKTIYDRLPRNVFVRVSKSYIINVNHLSSFDNNSVFIQTHEIPIGNAYRTYFFEEFVSKKLFSR